MAGRFEDSPKYEDWIEETDGDDSQLACYYEKWNRRERIRTLKENSKC